MLEAEIWNIARTDKGTAVLIHPLNIDKAVPIFIGPLEVHAILIGISGIPIPRPLTHDLLLEICEKQHLVVEQIEINDLKEGTFFAKIIFKHGIKKIVLDARPSDALSISTRTKCPIYISKAIMDEAGIPLSLIEERGEEFLSADTSNYLQENDLFDPSKKEQSAFKDALTETPSAIQRSVLEKELEHALQLENYEEAARLRDVLQKLK